jgi:hypothetical protein
MSLYTGKALSNEVEPTLNGNRPVLIFTILDSIPLVLYSKWKPYGQGEGQTLQKEQT